MSLPFYATQYSSYNSYVNNYDKYDSITSSFSLDGNGTITFFKDTTMYITIVGGGGGGSGGYLDTPNSLYLSGGGGSGGSSGTYSIKVYANDVHTYNVGNGGLGGIGNLAGSDGDNSYINFGGESVGNIITATGGNIAGGSNTENIGGSTVEPPIITGENIIINEESNGGSGGNGVYNVPGNGTSGSTNSTPLLYINTTTQTYLGSGGGGASASSTQNPPTTAGNGGSGGNGNTGGTVGSGNDTTTPTGGDGLNATIIGAGGGGGGQPGTNSRDNSGNYITYGGNGAIGAIYIWFTYITPTTGCSWPSELQEQTSIWTRDNGKCQNIDNVPEYNNNSSYETLNEKRKAVIFQYKNNASGFSKKQHFSRLSRGLGKPRGKTYANQGFKGTNPNSQRLPLFNNTLICSGANKISGLTSQNDTPGPVRSITNWPDVPLTNYIVRRTYKGGSEKWPQYGANVGGPREPEYSRSNIISDTNDQIINNSIIKQVTSKIVTNSVTTDTTDIINASDSGYSLDITPSSINSSIYILFRFGYRCSTSANQTITFFIYRTIGSNPTTLLTKDINQGTGNAAGDYNGIYSSNYMDAPNTTLNVNYSISFQVETEDDTGDTNSYPGIICDNSGNSSNCLVLQEY